MNKAHVQLDHVLQFRLSKTKEIEHFPLQKSTREKNQLSA